MQADKSNFQAYSKVRGLLTSASEELPDVPLYYNLHTICKTLHVTPPANNIVRSALVNAGEHSCTSAYLLPYCRASGKCVPLNFGRKACIQVRARHVYVLLRLKRCTLLAL